NELAKVILYGTPLLFVISLGALCCCRDLRSGYPRILVWCISLAFALQIVTLYNLPVNTVDVNLDTFLGIQQNISPLKYFIALMVIASQILWIVLWSRLLKLPLQDADEEEYDVDEQSYMSILSSKYCITFLLFEIGAYAVYYLFWSNL
ncbi:MAG: hypothetical protein K2K68_05430, partial [Duncaniella sp.]|nr:hypothetical protein [Duncaniella sp.]